MAVLAIIVALGLASVIGQAFELVFFVQMMITMIGLAVGIDYALFIISRFREELAKGLGKLEAVERAGAAAGRTVLFSGVTVIIALCGTLLIPSSFFQSIGVGANTRRRGYACGYAHLGASSAGAHRLGCEPPSASLHRQD